MALPASNIDTLAEQIFAKIKSYGPEYAMEKIRRAYQFAKQAHQGQLRKSGEPYLTHPLRTVNILADLHVDEDTLVAGFLHDVPEDTTVSIAEIEAVFGKKVGYLVDGITKLAKVHYREKMEQRQIESLKKLFIHSAEDLRVILIKLADRLDNMRTLRFIAEEKKRQRIARETLEVYVPIANLLGIGEIRAELEDLCFSHLYPLDYETLKREVDLAMEQRLFILKEMVYLTEREFNKLHKEAQVVGRPKTLYSIYKKLQTKKTLYNVEDLIAIRIIVPTRQDCYEALGIIHHLFKPKPGGIKDYVAVPKPNGYQSIHSTVFGVQGSVVEFQIRTRYMHLEAEYGIAAHYFYKYSDEQELTSLMQQRTSWVQRILDIQKDQKDPLYFLENLKLDIFQDRIFVFSPKGDVIDLPRGACAVDFAYAIHSEVGTHAAKGEINNTTSPLTTTLQTGDTVHITTDKEKMPEREWLNFVKTSLAANKIKEYLKQLPIEKKREIGKRFIQREFDRLGRNFVDELTPKRMRLITEKLRLSGLDDLLIAVGEGTVNPQKILEILHEERLLMRELRGLSFRHEVASKKPFLARIGLRIMGKNEEGDFREIIRTLNALHVPVVKFLVDRPWYMRYDRCRVSILVKNYKELAQVFESLEQLPCVEKINRVFINRKIRFIALSIVTALLWLTHPFLLSYLLDRFEQQNALLMASVYGGTFLLFGLVFYLKRLVRRSLPDLAEAKYFWPIVYFLNTLALFTVIGEVITFRLPFNWMSVVALIIIVYAILTASYMSYRQRI